MRKSTYESRMKSYIGMLIAFGIGMVVLGVVSQLQLDLNKTGTYAIQLPVQEVMVADVDDAEEVDEYEEYELEDVEEEYAEESEEEEDDLRAEIDPDDYDGTIVIATADEVITMTIDDDGIKHFTNHMIG
jgi:hypothetical protein